MKRQASSSLGFTLLEIVMTFVLFGIVAVVAVSYFATGVTHTDIPVKQLQTEASLQLVLENMIADKEAVYKNNLSGFYDALGNTGQSLSTYGNGTTYVIAEKHFVCPSENGFLESNDTDQFLLINIKPNVSSTLNITYIFSDMSAISNCTKSN